MENLSVALDWTPNTIHSGLIIASLKGWYAKADLNVKLISTEIDHYKKYPIQKLADGEVDIAMAPSEHVIMHNLAHPENKVMAIAPVFHTDTSIMVAKKEHGFHRPADLDQKTFLGYHTHFEQEVLSTMIKNDGGKGVFSTSYPEKLEVWDAFLKNQGDVCWVFTSWEYAQALYAGIELHAFKLSDFGVPYGYSPCLIIRADEVENRKNIWQNFLHVSAQGYRYTIEHIKETALQLYHEVDHTNFNDPKFLEFSLELVKDAFTDTKGRWGTFETSRWEHFMEWLTAHQLIKADPSSLQPLDFMVQW